MTRGVLIHLTDDASPTRCGLAVRFALVALADHRDVTVLLSGDAVGLARARSAAPPRCDADDIERLVAAFLDRGGRLWLMSSSATERGIRTDDLPDGAAVVTPWTVLEHLDGGSYLTF